MVRCRFWRGHLLFELRGGEDSAKAKGLAQIAQILVCYIAISTRNSFSLLRPLYIDVIDCKRLRG